MKEIVHCRKMASLCRERARFYYDEKWAWLAQAETWENRAAERITAWYKESNLRSSSGSGATSDKGMEKP